MGLCCWTSEVELRPYPEVSYHQLTLRRSQVSKIRKKRLVMREDRLNANCLTLGEDFRILRSLVLAVAAYVGF